MAARARSTTDLTSQPLFGEEATLPSVLPRVGSLRATRNLLTVFEDIHNHIYANEGILKDRIFHEMVKLLLMKLWDEDRGPDAQVEFGITADEYRGVRGGADTGFLARLDGLFRAVIDQHPHLFPDGERLLLRPASLAFVVSRLQGINLRLSPGDVKGQAFQTFVYRNQRGDRGEFFTPHPVVTLAVRMMRPQPGETVMDPACGSGGFLIEVVRQLRESGLEDVRRYVRDSLRGLEFNPDVARAAGVRLALEGGTGDEISCSDSLRSAERLHSSCDVVLTNPPFGSKGKITDPRLLAGYSLGHRWAREGSRWAETDEILPGQTPEVLFLELCVLMLRPGGRLGIVLPEGLLQNISNGYVRDWIVRETEPLAVVSLPGETFVPYGTGIKTSVLFLQRKPAPERSCFMARLRRLGYDVKGHPIYRRDSRGTILREPGGAPSVDVDVDEVASTFLLGPRGLEAPTDDRFFVPRDRLNARLDVAHYLPSDLSLVDELRLGSAIPLGEAAQIVTRGWSRRAAPDEVIRYIAISDIDPLTMEVVNHQEMPAHEAPSRATYRLRTGDIVTAVSGASTGTAGHASALIGEESDGAICSNGLAVLRDVHGVDPLYLLAYLRTPVFLRQVRRLMTGHAIPAISLDDLGQVLVPVPAAEDQARIAKKVEELQGLRRAAIAAGRQVVQDLMRAIS